MVMLDPFEEIRRLVEEEEIPLAEARALVREDLRSRQEISERGAKKSKGHPRPLQWTPEAAQRGNLNSRTKHSRKSST